MTQEHEIGEGDYWKELGRAGTKRENWDNCNHIINKIYFKTFGKKEVKLSLFSQMIRPSS